MAQLATADTANVAAGRAFWLIDRGVVKKLVVAPFLASAITDRAPVPKAGAQRDRDDAAVGAQASPVRPSIGANR